MLKGAARGKTRKTVLIRKGSYFWFDTNVEGMEIGAKVNCLVTYKRLPSCGKGMRIHCDEFALAPGDIMRMVKVPKKGKEFRQR